MAKNDCKSVVELTKVVDLSKEYTRQEVATLVGCIWANVLDASRGDNPKLKGSLKKVGQVQTWVFTGQQVLDWRRGVEARTSKGGARLVVAFETEAELDEFRKLLVKAAKGTKFEGKI